MTKIKCTLELILDDGAQSDTIEEAAENMFDDMCITYKSTGILTWSLEIPCMYLVNDLRERLFRLQGEIRTSRFTPHPTEEYLNDRAF